MYEVKKNGDTYEIVNKETGNVAAVRYSKEDADHMCKLMNNVHGEFESGERKYHG